LLLPRGVSSRSDDHGEKEKAMWRANGTLRRLALVAALGIGLGGLALATPAQAGGIHVSIGLGIPAPVYVAPPPLVVAPAPVIVQPAPSVIYEPPVVVTPPYLGYWPHIPPGHAKRYYGYAPVYGYKAYKKHPW
jgi:hypothetical protein